MSEQTADAQSRQHPTGRRRQRLRASHSYGFVLALVVVTFLFTAFAPDQEWAHSVIVLLMSATLAVSLWTSGLTTRTRVPAIVLATLGVIGSVGQLFTADTSVYAGLGLFAALLATTTCVVIGVGVIDQREVNQQSVLGVVSIYVLIGMVYTSLYGAVAQLGNGPFFAQGVDGDPSLHLYFSYVTLATLGYGDYTAATQLGRSLSVTEALVGQIYLVTVIAVVVGRLSRRRSPGAPE